MSRLVGTMLEQGHGALYQKVLALKYLLLLDDLKSREEASEIASHLDQELDPFRTLSALDVVRQASPFFWLNVARLLSRSPKTPTDFQGIARHFLTQAFDSFFGLLADGSEITLRANAGDLVFPRLGLRIADHLGTVRLRRESDAELTIRSDRGKLSIALPAVPQELSLPRLPIRNHAAQLLLINDPALLDSTYGKQLCPETPAAPRLAAMLADCLDLIESVKPELSARLEGLIRWYFPLHTPDMQIHNSFSSAGLIGVVFLSEAYVDCRLAEAMVHEFHHNELYSLMEVDPLISEEPPAPLYSPWRPDPRPFYGLFHALHVFSGVADFYRSLEQHGGPGSDREEWRSRRRFICFQLRTGLLQAPREFVTERGLAILGSIESELEEHEAELGTLPAALPEPQQQHLEVWRRDNPELAAQVRGVSP